jgi:hypothetical protein
MDDTGSSNGQADYITVRLRNGKPFTMPTVMAVRIIEGIAAEDKPAIRALFGKHLQAALMGEER